MTRVLVAVDETEQSVRAADVAYGLFGDEADYLAVSVATAVVDPAVSPWGAGWGLADPVTYGGVWSYRTPGRPTERSPDDAIDAADEARAIADGSELPDAEAIGSIGDPAETILRVADERSVDVIVLGTQDRSWFDRLLRPSVSTDIIKKSDTPVLIVK